MFMNYMCNLGSDMFMMILKKFVYINACGFWFNLINFNGLFMCPAWFMSYLGAPYTNCHCYYLKYCIIFLMPPLPFSIIHIVLLADNGLQIQFVYVCVYLLVFSPHSAFELGLQLSSLPFTPANCVTAYCI